MSQNTLILLFCAFGIVIYLITYLKKRPEALLFFLGRGAAGLLYIYSFNLFCAAKGITTYVGLNPLSGTISAFLGLPGVLLLYAVQIYRLFP